MNARNDLDLGVILFRRAIAPFDGHAAQHGPRSP